MAPCIEMNPRHIGTISGNPAAVPARTATIPELNIGHRRIMNPFSSVRAFGKNTGGAVTIWATGWTIVFLLIGGIAIDAGNAWKERAMLQATADAAALAGAIEMYDTTKTAAVTEAIRVADANMNNGVLLASAVVMGAWDMDTRTLDTAALVPDAVQAVTERSGANGNQVPTFLLKLAGIASWDVSTTATAQRFLPGCILDGMVAANTVQVSSNNAFVKGYCIHGQNGVQVSSNNSFEGPNANIPGVIVSMNDLADFAMPSSAFASSPGLEAALRENWMEPKLVNHVDEIIAELTDLTSDRIPSYINKSLPVIKMTRPQFSSVANSMQPGRIYNVTCNPNQSIIFTAFSTLQDVVLVTNCKITNTAHVSVFNSIMASSNSSVSAITAGFNMTIGKDDNCAAGGGSLIMAKGGINFAAASEIYGSQIVSPGNIRIEANAGGIEGASIQSGGNIQMTSNNAMGNCIGMVDEIASVDYFRLVD